MSRKNKVTKISPESRNQLVGLVNQTAQYVSEGLTPTEALTKAGSEEEYPPDYIHRAAEAYNGAAHLHHFKESSYEARGDSFGLADSKEALTGILASRPVQPKTADYADLFSDDKRYFEALIPMRDKAASDDNAPTLNVKEALDNSSRLRDIELRAIDKAQEKFSEATDGVKSALRRARYKVSISDLIHVNKMASEFLTINGSEAIDIVTETTSMSSEEATKLSEFDYKSVRPDDELYQLFEDSLAVKRSALDAHRDVAVKESEYYCNDTDRTNLIYDIIGIEKTATPGFDFGDIPVENNDNLNTLLPEKEATLRGALTMSVLGKDNDAPTPADASADAQSRGLKSLLDPAFLEEVQKIELAKKMHTVVRDPLIASAARKPEDIQEALYELTSIAPAAVNYTPLLRSMLRRRLESKERMDPFDISNLLSTEQALKTRAQQ